MSLDFLVGRHAVTEALANNPDRAQELLLAAGDKGHAVARIVELARAAGVKIRRVERSHLDQIAEGAGHQGVGLRISAQAYIPMERLLKLAGGAGNQALIVVADHLTDPHNLGAVMRSALAAGAQALVIPKDRSCPLTPAVAKAAAGAFSLLPVCRVTNLTQALEELKKAGLWALAAATRHETAPWELDLNLPLALIVGSEGKGVGKRLLGACDLKATLPMASDSESLNASVAAGIMLFEIVRQRRMA